MNLQDLNFIQTCKAMPEQYNVCLDDGTNIGYIWRLCWNARDRIECYPRDLSTGDIKFNKLLYSQSVRYDASTDDSILIKCGDALCKYHNELAFLKLVTD